MASRSTVGRHTLDRSSSRSIDRIRRSRPLTERRERPHDRQKHWDSEQGRWDSKPRQVPAPAFTDHVIRRVEKDIPWAASNARSLNPVRGLDSPAVFILSGSVDRYTHAPLSALDVTLKSSRRVAFGGSVTSSSLPRSVRLHQPAQSRRDVEKSWRRQNSGERKLKARNEIVH